MVKIKEVSWFIAVTLNEKRTCYGSTQKNKESWQGALASKESRPGAFAEHRRETWNLMDGAEHTRRLGT